MEPLDFGGPEHSYPILAPSPRKTQDEQNAARWRERNARGQAGSSERLRQPWPPSPVVRGVSWRSRYSRPFDREPPPVSGKGREEASLDLP